MSEAAALARARARVGQTIHGKYRLDRLLGIGGMASVYAATHRNKKRVAVKMLHPELSIHEGLRTRFMREGYVANTVEHPGAVAVLDDDVAEDGSAFLVMELLEGATLDELCARQGGRLPLREVLAVAEQVLDVLAAADAKQIVHRDIKPSNVFVTRQGQIKVLDFGVARLREGEEAHATHSGMALGTPAFMAPEQALGRSEEISGRTDVWAVGATMVALLTGRLVHEASSAQEQMVFAATRRAPFLGSLDPSIPADVAAIVDRALSFDRAGRWPGAVEMRDAVREAARALWSEPLALSTLGALAAEVGPAVSADSPSDPLATTVAVPSGVPPGRATPGPQISPVATSLVGTSAHTSARPPAPAKGRARVLIGGATLLLAGAAVGAWVATHGRAESAPAVASAMSSAPAAESASALAAAPDVPPAPSASPSASSVPVAPPAASSPPGPARPRPVNPSPAPSKPPTDRFDRQ